MVQLVLLCIFLISIALMIRGHLRKSNGLMEDGWDILGPISSIMSGVFLGISLFFVPFKTYTLYQKPDTIVRNNSLVVVMKDDICVESNDVKTYNTNDKNILIKKSDSYSIFGYKLNEYYKSEIEVRDDT